MSLRAAYFALAALGLISALTLNGIAILNGEDYGAAWSGSAVDWVLSSDLAIVAIAAVMFMVVESRRLGIPRVWVLIALSCVTAMAFTFPLFLAIREKYVVATGPR